MGVQLSCPLAGLFDVENLLQSHLEKSVCDDGLIREKPPLIGASEEEDEPRSPKHEAALKLQKVYKSFRTRRKLADCAILVDQNWWTLLDFAELEHSSVSFFDGDKHESAVSKWSRAGARAAKVGKGLSKYDNARKLAIQHWLEAIDPRHRYGHNLHFYYMQWLHSKSVEPFFYWLDVGEGRGVNLEKCSRTKLQQQAIKYLGPAERMAYEVVVEEGRFLFKQSREILHTTEDAKWIFVLSTAKSLYVGIKKKGAFQHSSFLAGGVTIAAGRIVAEHGVLTAVWPHSGHYRPTKENFNEFISFLKENSVDLADVKMAPPDEDEQNSMSGKHLRSNSLESMSEETGSPSVEEEMDSGKLSRTLEIPTIEDDDMSMERRRSDFYRLGRKLSRKWTTGAGPRIGCVRDCPSELQSRALEHVNLSPRTADRSSRRCVLAR